MKIKKISLLLGTLVLALGLSGCMAGGGADLPEGDVKIISQPVQGVLDFVLQSTGYGTDKSIITSMALPPEAAYDITLIKEQYKDGELVETKDVATYTTGVLDKKSVVHMIINAGKTEDEGDKTMYSFAEIDAEKTTDKKNPMYKITNVKEEALNYDVKSELGQTGKNLDEEAVVTGYVKFKEDDTTKAAINLDTYKDEVSKYAEVNIVKLKATKR